MAFSLPKSTLPLSPSSDLALSSHFRRHAVTFPDSIISWPQSFPVLKASAHHARSVLVCCSSSMSATPLPSSSSDSASKSEEYNRTMQRQMRNPYEYHHDLGMYYTRIIEGLIVGSQPQTPDDVDKLYKNEGVRAILNLQQDKDIEYWGVDLVPIMKRCDELGVQYLRAPARDFDPNSLRTELPRAVCLLDGAISQGKTVYVHCTAGLGRAPGIAIAYLFWFNGMNLDGAYNFLTSKRPCGPRKEAIRGATYDLAKNDAGKEPFEELPEYAYADVAAWERQLIQERVRSLR